MLSQIIKKTHMKKYFLFIVLSFTYLVSAQTSTDSNPVFPGCENELQENQKQCFNDKIQNFFYENFKVPSSVSETDFKGNIIAVFEVDTTGSFKVIYIDASSIELKSETENIFKQLPKVQPALHAGRPTFAKYSIKIPFPLVKPGAYSPVYSSENKNNVVPMTNATIIDKNKELTEFADVAKSYQKFNNPQFKSALNIAFSHANYDDFDQLLNQVGSNNHTATKPYSYAEVAKYYDFEAANVLLLKKANSWWARKLWNENLVAIQTEDYWFTLNPILNLQIGKDLDSNLGNTFVNTRGLQLQGGLGKNITFSTAIYESQGRFADYYNAYAASIKPAGGDPAIIPGIGIAKQFKKDAFDFPLAEANIKYKPAAFLDLQLGYGRNFIGDGYRSLLQSDGASPYPFFKINTTFWKIKYTNTYMWLKDVRPESVVDGTYASKYMASHYLSYNVSKRWNVGFFENVVWTNTNNRGFDANFVNPIIFYRVVEFNSSARSGNAVLGLTSKYKVTNQINLYSQFIIDEFAIGDVRASNKSWRNKFGYQLGVKYYNAFSVKNLNLQLEYNHVRPYVYSHKNVITNYAHNNQSLGHNWGGNFRELVAIARYKKGRFFGQAKFIYGQRGFDFNTPSDNFNYGGNIFVSYDDNRPYDEGVAIAQGNKTSILIADLQTGYLVNPSTNLKLFASVLFRDFNPQAQTMATVKSSTTWFSVGIKSDLFNWYFDY
jgi:hypothetical protein